MKLSNCPKMRIVFVGFVAAIILGGGRAKADFTFGTSQNLGPPFNTAYNEYDSCISADGYFLFFASNRPGSFGGDDIWVATRATPDDSWEDPVNLGPMVNTQYFDADPGLSADGLSLYFRSNRPGGFGGEDIWVTTRMTRNDSWSEPVNLGSPVNSIYDESDPSISADGLSLYFSEWANPTHPRPGGYGKSDIWVATRPTNETPWSEPVNLGPVINNGASDFMQGISADGLILFFASDREGGFGMFDLYMARRATTSEPWGESVNLGPSVNSWEWDTNPDISADGSILYFDSWRSGNSDIWQVPIIPIVDFNSDGIVNSVDMCIMVDHWGENYPLCDIGPMPWGDGIVDVQDLIVLAEHLFEEVLPSNLIAYWKLDEAEGNVAYNCINDNHGILYGEPQWQPDNGQKGGALQFDGIDDYISTDLIFDPSSGLFSVFAWIKGGAAGQVILSQEGGSNWLMADSVDGALQTDLKEPATAGRDPKPPGPPLICSTVVADGDWHRVGFVRDGSNRILYVDDIEVARDIAVNLEAADGGLYIGAGSDLEPDTFWSGLIDDVRIYNRAVKP